MSGGGGGGSQGVGHGTAPGPWANGGYIAPPPSLQADPNTYINRLLEHGKAPTIPDTFSAQGGDGHGGGHGSGGMSKTTIAGIAAGAFALAYLVGKGRIKAAGQQGQSLLKQVQGLFKKPQPTP